MLREDDICPAEGRDGACNPRYPRTSAPREWYTVDSPVEELGCRLRAPKHIAVAQSLPCGDDASPHRRRGFSRGRRKLLGTRPRHRDHQIEAVEKCPRDLFPIRGDSLWTAAAIG